MSEKKTEKKERKHLLRDERFRIALGISVVLFSIFLFIAFISFLFTWQQDQRISWDKLFLASIVVDNWSGKLGAVFANIFMNHWFGISSLVLPFILLLIGLRMLKIKLLPIVRTTRTLLIGAVIFSVIMGYITGTTWGYLGSGIGGGHGFFISRWLCAFAGTTGAGFILFLIALTYVMFTSHRAFLWVKGLVTRPRKAVAAKLEKETLETSTSVEKENTEVKEDIIKEIHDDSIELVFERPKESDFIIDEKNIEEEIYETPSVEDTNIPVEIEERIDEPQMDFISPVTMSAGNFDLDIEEKSEDLVARFGKYDPTLDLGHYQFPPVNLMDDHKSDTSAVSNDELIANKNKIVETLANYKIQIDKVKATVGPTVTLYEIVPAPGIRISKIKSLEDDIALSLAALGIRIIAPIPGRGTIGIEVPNSQPEIVSMRSIISSKKFQETKFDLAIALGKTISNETYVVDLAKMPHLLVAGATGQGKSVGLNAIITSLLYKKHPSELKFVLVDPKKVELTLYSKLERHYLAKLPETEEAIITDTQKVIHTLQSLTIEMDQRYDLLKKAHVRNLKEYNVKFCERKLNPENGHRFMPYIVVVIDEFADLIMTAGKEIETPIARLAQLARAIGIHLIIATQRPTTNIITGVIKANFPARIAFRVSSMIDSRTILDSPGANQLIGRGDMLISNGNDLIRVQCAFIDTPEIESITDFIGSQKGYASAMLLPEVPGEEGLEISEVDLEKRDSLFEDAARLMVIHQQGSTSLIQRKFSIGYNRAGRIMDQLEAAGIVGPFEGSKARQVLIQDELSLEHIFNGMNRNN
jgi:DNA segregation ATPase FtsK/SpoIIIE, S-DNA-T family